MTALTVPATPGVRAIGRRSVVSWLLYDLANTAFSLGIVSLYYPGLLRSMGYEDDTLGTLDSLAALLIFIAAPVLGALSDQASRRLPFLVVSTLLCVGATFLLGQTALLPAFALFVIATVCFQAGLIFYDSLLPEVSTDANRGRIGGLGVGIGYTGSLLAIIVGAIVLPADPMPADYATVFRAIALVFLLFALPAFLFIRERPRVGHPLTVRLVADAFGQLRQTAARARAYRGVPRFLVGRMFYTDSANTLILMIAVFAMGSFGFTQAEANQVAVPSILAAIPAGIAWGVVVDRIGPKRSLDIVLGLWLVVFAVAAAIPALHLPRELIWLVSVGVGVALAGTWASDRPLMARIAPPRYYGQFYGLYAMVGRFSAIVGPFMWGFIAKTLGWGQPAAVMFLFLWVAIAIVILRPVDDRDRDWGPEDLPEPAPSGATAEAS